MSRSAVRRLRGATLAAVLLAACGREQAAAKVDLARVDAACAKGDAATARQALAEAAARNRAFNDALEDAKANWGGADPERMNPCGVILEDLRRRIDQP